MTQEAGWYDDPQDNSNLRYWDGVQWTNHTSPKQRPGREQAYGGQSGGAGQGWQQQPGAGQGAGQQGAPGQQSGYGQDQQGGYGQGQQGGYGRGQQGGSGQGQQGGSGQGQQGGSGQGQQNPYAGQTGQQPYQQGQQQGDWGT
ncbi:MAG: DUF2510 domain-containing protein, partial [Actinomycetota bacterium]|nr:DUF2510 domain-containing protein [Actinomycetota bacterium]